MVPAGTDNTLRSHVIVTALSDACEPNSNALLSHTVQTPLMFPQQHPLCSSSNPQKGGGESSLALNSPQITGFSRLRLLLLQSLLWAWKVSHLAAWRLALLCVVEIKSHLDRSDGQLFQQKVIFQLVGSLKWSLTQPLFCQMWKVTAEVSRAQTNLLHCCV